MPARGQLVFLRNGLSALRVRPGWSQDRPVAVGRPHAVGGRVNCAARIKSRSVRVAVGIEMLLWSSPSKA